MFYISFDVRNKLPEYDPGRVKTVGLLMYRLRENMALNFSASVRITY
jgi:hypothetical protein